MIRIKIEGTVSLLLSTKIEHAKFEHAEFILKKELYHEGIAYEKEWRNI